MWTVMVIDRVRQSKLPTHIPMVMRDAFCIAGRFMGGDICHMLKVSWVSAELEETRQVNDAGLAVDTQEAEVTPLEVPTELNIHDCVREGRC